MGGGAISIGRYFTEMLDPSMNWSDVAEMVKHWGGPFCLKGIMTVADAKRAIDIGCAASYSRTMEDGSSTARAPPLTSSPRSSMRSATGST